MSDTNSTNLSLPYIVAAQAQKHVTHNEAIRTLDAIVQLAVEDRDLAEPPALPQEGSRYIPASGATGVWAGKSGQIAAWQDGSWTFLAPREGWVAWVADEDRLMVWDGEAWTLAGGGIATTNPVPLVGINATADMVNKLAVASDASLFNHAGNGHQLKINKAAPTDTGSVLFQTGYSGRAEFGLAGDDNWHVKVSADGTQWREAIVVERATGAVSFPNTTLGGAGSSAITGMLMQGDAAIDLATSNVEAGGPAFRMVYTLGSIDDTAPTGTDYYDHTMQLGFNMGVGGARHDAAHPAFGVQWESKFRQNGSQPFGWEWHVRAQDAGANERRPISIFGCHSAAEAASELNGITFQANNFTLQSWTGAPVFQYKTTSGWHFQNGINYDFNNAPVAKQYNAARTGFLNLPYFDATDKLQLTGPFQLTGQSRTDNSYAFISAVATMQPNHSIFAFNMTGPVAGTVGGLSVVGSTTNGPIQNLIQQGGNTWNSNAVEVFRVLTGSGGDPYTIWEINGVTSWSCGLNNSANDAWQLCLGGYMGAECGATEYLFALPTAVVAGGVAGSSVPWRIPSYTVTQLPTLRAADAGALAYVSNASGGPTLACWNGSAWKVVSVLGATVA